ncbi:opioid growth factor receptor-related protein [uncultured Neptuniibacter sp.]|uniref:opioid growth factor receptor-related protein n=1 Tax=uncultured Neptuniibacter sp. TaxID=502143 RepID=UPI002629211E|nr:opioid growth factor receptor-related protein [uncultured Neptuniibacter sp.]
MSRIVEFMLEEAPDHKDRYISDLWQLDHFWLEHTHDYIQWLFPTVTSHKRNSFAPCLSRDDKETFASNPQLRQQQLQSYRVMLDFFGLEEHEGQVIAQSNLNMRQHIWLKRGGHNHLRISRIIQSLALCSNRDQATALQKAVIGIGQAVGQVSEESLHYWSTAIKI